MDFSALLNTPSALAAAIAAAATALYKGIRSLLAFNDEYLRRRRYKHLAFLAEQTGGSEHLSALITAARSEFVFSETFKHVASPREMNAIRDLYATGLFSLRQLRSCFFYIRFDGKQPDIFPGRTGIAILLMTIPLLLSLAISGLVFFVKLASTGESIAIAVGIAFMLMFVAMGWSVARDSADVLIARKAGAALQKYRLESQENSEE